MFVGHCLVDFLSEFKVAVFPTSSPEGSAAKHRYPQSSYGACALRHTAQRRWWLVSVRRCVGLRQHQYQLRRANQPKTGGRRRRVARVCKSSGRRCIMGDQKVSPSRRNRCLRRGETPFQGVAYKGRRGRVCGCGTSSRFPRAPFVWARA